MFVDFVGNPYPRICVPMNFKQSIELSCIVMHQISYPRNNVPMDQQNFDNPQTLTPTNTLSSNSLSTVTIASKTYPCKYLIRNMSISSFAIHLYFSTSRCFKDIEIWNFTIIRIYQRYKSQKYRRIHVMNAD